jgi:hypothetical protein
MSSKQANAVIFEAVEHALKHGAPGISETMRRGIAEVAARRATHNLRFDAERQLIHQLGATVTLISDGLDDEGDRVYLESTNHCEVLKRAAELYDEYRIKRDDVGADVGIP